MTDPYPIRPIAEEEFPAFFAVGDQAFNSRWPAAPLMEHELGVFEFGRSLAAFDQGAVVGTAVAYSFRMTVPGGLAATGGVSAVSVLPTYRRRGILSSLMRRQLADIRETGEAIGALFASESGIYGRFGYGCASEQLRFAIRRGEGALRVPSLLPAPGRPGSQVVIRAVEPEESRAELAKVYDLVLPHRPGMMARDDRWWANALADLEFAREGYSPLRAILAEDESGPRGYATFSAQPQWSDDDTPSGKLSIRELFGADPAATVALWSDLLTRDLIGEVRARQRPVDDPLLYLLADRRRARSNLTDGLWIRLTDVAGALAQRRYARPVDLVLEVADDLIPANSGRWRLQAGDPEEPPGCERTTAAADISLPVSALGAAYLGGTRLGALAAAGQVAEQRPGALARLSAAMTWDPPPWCPATF